MNLSSMAFAKMEKTAVVKLQNPYTKELLKDDKGVQLALHVHYSQSPAVIERVRDFKRDHDDESPTEIQFVAMMIDAVEGDMASDSVKLSNATLKDLDKVTKFLEEADFVTTQIIEVASDLKNYAPKTLTH